MKYLRNKNAPPLVGLVQEFIDTAYDTVKLVADNMDLVLLVGGAIEDGTLTDFLSANDINTLAKLNAIVADETIIAETSIDTLAKLNTLVTDANIASEAYVDAAVTGLYEFMGGYDANTNVPDLTTSPNAYKVAQSWQVTVAGTFFTATLEPGDQITAIIDNPSVEADWSIVNRNIDSAAFATAAQGAKADTALQPGEAATPAQGTLADSAVQPLDNISDLTNDAGYTDDQTPAEIASGYNTETPVVSQIDAEAGISTTAERWTPERVKQAIAALESPDSGGDVEEAPVDGKEYNRKDAGWVEDLGGVGGISEAPEDGTPYVRQDAGWVAETDGVVDPYWITAKRVWDKRYSTTNWFAANGKEITMIFCMKIGAAWGGNYRVIGNNGSTFRISTDGGPTAAGFDIQGYGTGGTVTVSMSNILTNTAWASVGISINTATQIARIVVDGVNVTGAVSIPLNSDMYFVSGALDWTHHLGFVENDMTHVWIKSEYLDIADPAVWAKFFDANNNPIDLGPNGELPTGVSPEHFAPDGNLLNNLGTRANWSTTNAPDNAPTSPTDDVVAPPGYFEEAPEDTKQYGRQDADWTEIVIPDPIPDPYFVTAKRVWDNKYTCTDLLSANGKEITMIFAIKLGDAWNGNYSMVGNNGGGFRLRTSGSSAAGGIDVQNGVSISHSNILTNTAWSAMGIAFNTATQEGRIVIDGVNVTTTSIITLDAIVDFTNGVNDWIHHLGNAEHDVTHIWIKSEYLDIAKSEIWNKFFNDNNDPIYLGANGELPTGVSPDHFAPDGDLTNNLGTRENWTGGASNAPTSPTDDVIPTPIYPQFSAFTVAELPIGQMGIMVNVTDGDAGLAWGATVVNTGAGATSYLVWYNGTNWIVAA